MPNFMLRVFLYKCVDLLAADPAFAGGKSDPYVVFSIGKQQKKSSCITNELNPVWHPPEKFEFEISEWNGQFLLVHVFDYDRFSTDDLIGSAVIPLALFAGMRHQELCCFPLVLPSEATENLKSSISLQITLTTKDGRPVHSVP